MTETNKQPTCAELVQGHYRSRMDALASMLDPKPEDFSLVDDGSLDTVVQHNETTRRWRFSPEAVEEYRDEDTGELTEFDDFIREMILDQDDGLREDFNEFGLCFDYVAPETFEDQDRGYFRYQLSWGGPSDEIRFYVTGDDEVGFELEYAEYWHLDWFDGACVRADDPIIERVWDEFNDTETTKHAFREAA